MALPAVTPRRFALAARWALWALVAIVITGASVRLTGSGLGCSDWPNCEPGEFVPAADFHGWVEFGNRIVTGVVSLAVTLAVGASLWRQPRRTDLVWWSIALVAGVAFQIGLGAVTVLTHLSPPIVMSHFLASQVLVAAAVVLCHRASGEQDRDGRSVAAPFRGLQVHAWIIAMLLAIALWTGTVVTGTGPHGGDEHVQRLDYALASVARLHGITVVVMAGLTLLLAARVRRLARSEHSGAYATAVARRVRNVVAVMAVQAAIGYLQYFNELPVLLVAVHVAGATLLTIAVTRLVLAASTRPQAMGSETFETSDPTSIPVVIAAPGFAE